MKVIVPASVAKLAMVAAEDGVSNVQKFDGDSKFYKMLKKRAKSIEEIDKQYDETLPFVPLYDFKLNGYGDIIFTLSAPTGKGEGEGSRTPKISLSNSDKQSTQFITLCLNKIADELL
jgi:hypothetical protein